jgi:hypothetical protein
MALDVGMALACSLDLHTGVCVTCDPVTRNENAWYPYGKLA